MIDLLEKLVETNFEDQFKPASDEELEKRGLTDFTARVSMDVIIRFMAPSGDDGEAVMGRSEAMEEAYGAMLSHLTKSPVVVETHFDNMDIE